MSKFGKTPWMALAIGGTVMAAALAAILLSADSSQSTAGAHPHLTTLSLQASDAAGGDPRRACDVAVDPEGRVYAANPDASTVEIFADGDRVGEIENDRAPCGVAVDSSGRVYVLEQESGDVVEYEPEAFPFDGDPAYRGAETVDSSGRARGVAVDSFDDSLFVAQGDWIDVYDSEGNHGYDEEQRLALLLADSGSFRLSFEGQETTPIPFDASPAEVEEALAALRGLSARSISVQPGPSGVPNYYVTFKGSLGETDVPLIMGDDSGLNDNAEILTEEISKGFDGRIGAGSLENASDVAAYTYGEATRYVFAAESPDGQPGRLRVLTGGSLRSLDQRAIIDGAGRPEKRFGFARAGAQIGVDPANGHVFVRDAEHSAVLEFEATGPYVGRIESEIFDGSPVGGIAVERSGEEGDGNVHVATAGSGGSEVAVFGALAVGHRPRLADFSKRLSGTLPKRFRSELAQFRALGQCGTEVDVHGSLYVSTSENIRVFDPKGQLLTKIEASRPCDMAVDSEGNLFATVLGREGEGDERVVVYRPDSFPITAATDYGRPETILPYEGWHRWVAINPRNDRLLVNANLYVPAEDYRIAEYESARRGLKLIADDRIGRGVLRGVEKFYGGLDICGRTGEIYVAGGGETGWRVFVLDPTGTRRLVAIDGSDSPLGEMTNHSSNIAVDQSNCHVFIYDNGRPAAEYEASGAFVASFGPELTDGDIVVDNGPSSPNRGNVYVVSRDAWLAFGPLERAAP